MACGAALRAHAKVTILESVKVVREIGAAVHLAPNATRIIKALGGDLLKYGAPNVKMFKTFQPDGTPLIAVPSGTDDGENQWLLNHRVDVLEELKELATRENGPGRPCELVLNTRVVGCDPEAGTVTTSTGEVYTADIIIASDGIKSAVRSSIVGDSLNSVPSGHSAYRMLIPASKINSDPELAALKITDPNLTIIYGNGRRIICYPCRNQTILNFVCILPDSELNEISEEKWTAKGDVASLVKSYSSFAPVYQKLLGTADEVGLWQLRDQEPLHKWTKGRAILLGDAAHAMLPHQGQGASQAIEDAEAIGALLQNVSPADVPATLEEIFRIRYKRATMTQQQSRLAGLGSASRGTGDEVVKQMEAHAMNQFEFKHFTWQYRGAKDWKENHPEHVLQV
ncbi:hypothetical protein FFLO_04300 [Filobasidium floriforme]|uniref:FAD-binding domain-containing protein n=1 Tax=Filobasidium floriforme TaxID=5210 RepID=A0A8K0JJ14_9TREE|nr:hypothetical protein FFLO_04300 [Filobasidium floriforme]